MPRGKKTEESNARLDERLENWRQSIEVVEEVRSQEKQFKGIANLPIPSTSKRSSLTLAMEMSKEIEEIKRRDSEIANATTDTDASSDNTANTTWIDTESRVRRNNCTIFENCMLVFKGCCVCGVNPNPINDDAVSKYLDENPQFITAYVVENVPNENILHWSRMKKKEKGGTVATSKTADAVVNTTLEERPGSSRASETTPLDAGDSSEII